MYINIAFCTANFTADIILLTSVLGIFITRFLPADRATVAIASQLTDYFMIPFIFLMDFVCSCTDYHMTFSRLKINIILRN